MILISKSTPSHAHGIHAIEKESLVDPWSVDSILYEINHKHSICLVATLGKWAEPPFKKKATESLPEGNIAGIHSLRSGGGLGAEPPFKSVIGHVTMRHIINEGHINNIVVAHEYRRLGVASLLMDALIHEAKALEMIGLTLEVRVSNKAALSLYNNFGFVIEGHRKNYYSHPNEDAAIMWKEFKDGAK